MDRIKARLPKLTASIPSAITVETILDRTVTIRAAVRDLELTLALTIGLVVLVVLLFLRNLWATLIPGTVVVLALLGSFAVMYVLNFSLDNISLMALTIATGFVVDDAIVVVENIYRHIERGAPPFEAALDGSREIAFTVLSISLSLVAVFIPLLLMGGIVGRVFREFSMTVAAAITVSALVSLTLAPVMCSRLDRIKTDAHGHLYYAIEAVFNAMLAGYKRTLDIALAHREITLGVFFVTLALTITLGIKIPKGFFPIQDTGVISGLAEAAQRVSPEEMMRLQRALGDVIRADPDVEGFASGPAARAVPATRKPQIPPAFDRAEAARKAQAHSLPDHRSAEARTRRGPGREAVPIAGPGHYRRRPVFARQFPVYLARLRQRGAGPLVAEDTR